MTTRENFGTFGGSWLLPFVSEEGRRDGAAPDPGNAVWRVEHGQFLTKHVGGKDAWVT